MDSGPPKQEISTTGVVRALEGTTYRGVGMIKSIKQWQGWLLETSISRKVLHPRTEESRGENSVTGAK